MRQRILNSVLPLIAISAISQTGLNSVAAEPAKSTIRIVSSAPAATPEAPPQRIVLPSQSAATNTELEPARAATTSIQTVAAPARPDVESYPVRPASHVAPAAPAPVAPAAPATANRSSTTAGPRLAPSGGRPPAVVNIYNSPNAQATLSRMPRPMTVQPRPKASSTPRRGKPFQSVPMEPAVSPYLNMYRRDVDGGNLPNYFAFVLPQLEQQQASRQQAAELQKLRNQVQTLGATASPPNSANMTSHARYMDTAQYYGGMKR